MSLLRWSEEWRSDGQLDDGRRVISNDPYRASELRAILRSHIAPLAPRP